MFRLFLLLAVLRICGISAGVTTEFGFPLPGVWAVVDEEAQPERTTASKAMPTKPFVVFGDFGESIFFSAKNEALFTCDLPSVYSGLDNSLFTDWKFGLAKKV